jgi:DNA-binding transcriptional LysR family regulator
MLMEQIMLDEMRAFAILAEVGSVQRTAERLFVTQSAVTRQIQRLEDELGVTLLDRRSKPSKLTPVGWTVLERCRSILKSVADLKSSTSSDGEPSGVLRIGVGNALADDDMADRLRDLSLRFPRLAIHVKSDWTPALIENVRRGLLDVAVAPKRPGVMVSPDVIESVIGREKLVFVAARDRKPKPVSLDHLATLQWVLKPKGCGTRETLRLLLERKALPLNIAAEVRDENMQLSLIARGIGIGLVSMRSVRRHARQNNVRILEVLGVSLFLEIVVLQGNFLGCLSAAAAALEKDLAGRYGPTR